MVSLTIGAITGIADMQTDLFEARRTNPVAYLGVTFEGETNRGDPIDYDITWQSRDHEFLRRLRQALLYVQEHDQVQTPTPEQAAILHAQHAHTQACRDIGD